ncbi:hypothetical protein ACTXPA_08910 [Glutamicibacter arilaitensis]|uniref:hypothetical protein n=1 Tax=Glutamicibacter arilaitensis TaxID=256701 RepID=UPI003FD15094
MKQLTPIALGIALIASTGIVSGCSGNKSLCLPEPITASAPNVNAGAEITVSAAPARCNLGYDEQKSYSLLLLSEASNDEGKRLPQTPVNSDGSFSVDIHVPAETPKGNATLLVQGSPFDSCSGQDSCAAYSVSFIVE